MTKEVFEQKYAIHLPDKPGIYRYFNAAKEIIYVGKAKSLKKRVRSYFTGKVHEYKKTELLVNEMTHIECTMVNTEHDALLLETTLIQLHRPKYNIDLKDDKSFPFIVIKNERFPRVFLTRNKFDDQSEYLGPFTSVRNVRDLLNYLNESLQLRTCSLNLSERNIAQKKFRPCLQYHMGKCKAPCAGFQQEEDYNWHIAQIKEILKGKTSEIEKIYKTEMLRLAEKLEFEQAEVYRKKIEHLKHFPTKSIIANTNLGDSDILGIIREKDRIFISYLHLSNGNLSQTYTESFEKKWEERDEEILPVIFLQMRNKLGSLNKKIILRAPINIGGDFEIKIPRIGDAVKLLELAEKNAFHLKQEEKRKAILNIQQKDDKELEELLENLQQDLRLPFFPSHIECFDNSNMQGSYPVAAMVCFKNGKPSKKDYRRFNIKTIDGIDDFASMKEITFRRYKRLKDEGQTLPQLVIIDGGKGQLNAALSAINELDMNGQMTIIGLAKNVEEIFFPGDKESVKLAFESETLQFIRRIRDEVHRFGITFHRNKRSKGVIKNELENIDGIGEKTARILLRRFKSVKKIKEANEAELIDCIGPVKARRIIDYFK